MKEEGALEMVFVMSAQRTRVLAKKKLFHGCNASDDQWTNILVNKISLSNFANSCCLFLLTALVEPGAAGCAHINSRHGLSLSLGHPAAQQPFWEREGQWQMGWFTCCFWHLLARVPTYTRWPRENLEKRWRKLQLWVIALLYQ